MFVKAAKGHLCPKEGKHQGSIDDKTAVEVPDTLYYHRLVMDGSLIVQKNANREGAKDAKK